MNVHELLKTNLALGLRAAWKAHHEKWGRMTPEEQAREERRLARKQRELNEHIAWLDWCAKNRVDPNLVK